MNKLGTQALIVFIIKRIVFSVALFIPVALFMVMGQAPDSAYATGFIIFVILGIFWGYLTYANYVYSVDSDGVTIERGILLKKKNIIPYRNIQNVDINRGILDRALGVANVTIQTAGNSNSQAEGMLPELAVAKAEELQKKILSSAKK